MALRIAICNMKIRNDQLAMNQTIHTQETKLVKFSTNFQTAQL